jgi:hypothetical protein
MIIKTIKIPVLEWQIVPADPKSPTQCFEGTVGLAMTKFSFCKTRRVPAKLQYKMGKNGCWHAAAECVEE